jgi:hypothetical protein
MIRPIDSLILQPGKRPRCEFIVSPYIMPGWACCACSSYNGIWRRECKTCGHARCKPLWKLTALPKKPKADRFYAAKKSTECVCGVNIEPGEPVYLDAGRWNCDKHGFEAATRKAQGR